MPLQPPPGFPAPAASVIGHSGSGKTLVMERLVREFRRRGYRIAAVKHAAHGFQLDRPGTDSARLAEAGASLVLLTAPGQVAALEPVDGEPDLAALASRYCAGMDLVLIEGYKRLPLPKVEVWWSRVGGDLLTPAQDLLALVCDRPFDLPAPQFRFEDAAPLADLLEKTLLK